MNKPVKLRYVNQIVGSLILVVLMALLVIIFFVARQQGWFVQTYQLHAFLPEDKLDGLRRGTEVILLGKSVGTLERVEYAGHQSGLGQQLKLTMRIRRDPDWPIYAGSELHIKKYLAGAGEAFLEIRRAEQRNEVLDNGDEIVIKEDPGAQDQLQQVTHSMMRIYDEFRRVRESMVPAFNYMQIVLGRIEETNTQLQQVARDFEEFSPKLSPLAERTSEVVEKADDVVESIREETADLPGTIEEFRGNLSTAQDVLDGLRSHWLLRRYVDQEAGSETISPAEVGRGGPR